MKIMVGLSHNERVKLADTLKALLSRQMMSFDELRVREELEGYEQNDIQNSLRGLVNTGALLSEGEGRGTVYMVPAAVYA